MAKTIGIGITGGIAAYKIADLVSKLKKEGFEVIVMMTEGATKFITPLTLETLSGREVVTDVWQKSREWKVQHIGIADELDMLVIAPATANFLAKMAHGIADDLLSTICVANTAPVLVVPSMNTKMYENVVVQSNMDKLMEYGYQLMVPTSGKLACDAVGKGRLPEVEEIIDEINRILLPLNDLKGKRIMINAGSTCEDLDPVRFICNRATGKMGYSIAEEAVNRGAETILVSGKTSIKPPRGVEYISVWSADEMYEVMLDYHPSCDAIVGAAAVSDFKIANMAGKKLKKTEQESDKLVIELIGTPDILKELGKIKREDQVMVGFAAETNDLVENATKKLVSKNLDFIVANDVTCKGAGFACDTNIVTIIQKDGKMESLPIMSKSKVAAAIIDKVVELF
ncbi:MAG TPA: bifunctional phosphopantothenoylcysteine decarboxylase/phosphopantothenate--cysteine ligase CoaBC [Syntrophomonadaceae bacterium]|nr:bifunctional phosphopantothenoylcysteine decarboxylase/phosphopantothenate--cysteine ligase CoaBC [Syntrophomonadaceae bacterium]